MSRYNAPKSPCGDCSRNCYSAKCGEPKGCAAWQSWFSRNWILARQRLLDPPRPRCRETWIYYSPDELAARDKR